MHNKKSSWHILSLLMPLCRNRKRGFNFNHIKNTMSTPDKLLKHVQKKDYNKGFKVTVVGCGQVGMATIIAMLAQNVTNQIAMVDTMEHKLMGEMMDLHHGSSFLGGPKIQASSKDYSITAGSKICVITAGVRRQHASEDRLGLVQINTDAFKTIIPQLVEHSPDAIFLIATNPVDILTYVAWKLSGFPKHRIIGTGTNLDSARFRYLLSEKLGVAPTSCHGYIIGEHGDHSVPVWSSVNIAGVRLTDLNPKMGDDEDRENWKRMHEEVVKCPHKIIQLKGSTCWAIGLSLAQIVRVILTNARSVKTVTTYIKGIHGIEDEVFLSLPCVLGNKGVTDVVRQPLNDSEITQLRKNAQAMAKIQEGIQF